ncbi:MAG: MmcQ/YjbR family DNA-binding protein [Ignavibacteria bacterium]|nr:MmcQ/YjbR family DNA-binding protein [Ignavibacteria bacterium]
MSLLEIREYCLSKPGAFEDTPFGPDTLTFKVAGKIFLFASLESIPGRISLKGHPEQIQELRETYSDVVKGAYLNAKHWTSIILTGTVPNKLIFELIDTSYDLVVKGLTQAQRNSIE